MNVPETWIRVEPYGTERTVVVWVHLGDERTLLIRRDGTHNVTGGWSTFGFKTRTSCSYLSKGIVRIS